MEPTRGALLVVGDDQQAREALAFPMRRHGWRVVEASGAREAERRLASGGVDLVVVDARIDDADPLEFCRSSASHHLARLVLVTDSDDAYERAIALEAGADDCLSRPVHARELVARVRAVLRRGRPLGHVAAVPSAADWRFAGWSLCLESQRLLDPAGGAHRLSRNDFVLIRCLAENAGQTVSRSRLRELLALDGDSGPRVADYAIHRLRQRLANLGLDLPVTSVFGRGYQLAVAADRLPQAG